MQVTFTTRDFGDEAASLRAAADGAAPADEEHLWGEIVLDSPGAPPLVIADDLTMLGMALCVNVPAALLGADRTELHLAGPPVDYAVEAGADSVMFSGTLGDSGRFPRAALLAALAACGQRLAVFMTALSDCNPQYGYAARALSAKLPPAPVSR